jgi:hypothetical protein
MTIANPFVCNDHIFGWCCREVNGKCLMKKVMTLFASWRRRSWTSKCFVLPTCKGRFQITRQRAIRLVFACLWVLSFFMEKNPLQRYITNLGPYSMYSSGQTSGIHNKRSLSTQYNTNLWVALLKSFVGFSFHISVFHKLSTWFHENLTFFQSRDDNLLNRILTFG